MSGGHDFSRRFDVLTLADKLRHEGRLDDALTLYQHLLGDNGDPVPAWAGVALTHLAAGQVLPALQALAKARGLVANPDILAGLIHELSPHGTAAFNTHLSRGEIALAEPYAAAMSDLMPSNAQTLSVAMGCNQALGRLDRAAKYAQQLHVLEPDHVGAMIVLADKARDDGDDQTEIELRTAMALSPDPTLHPLVRLRDFHDAMSKLLCRDLDNEDYGRLSALAVAAHARAAEVVPEDPEWTPWIEHYQSLLSALDIEAIRAPTPELKAEPAQIYLTAAGETLDDAGLKALADRLDVEVVYFAAADEKYVEQYARWYALSMLRHSDLSSLVVVHVIGGADRLAEAVKTVGVTDERLVFVGDRFDASAVPTLCYDAPPKGLIPLPVAHFQSVRFQRLGALLAVLQRPIFVSDIDLLLQRGVKDLLEQWDGTDVVFNENGKNFAAGSRITANLLLVYPTENAQILLRWLRVYLDKYLDRPRVTRWIDQVALLLGRHHLRWHGGGVRIGAFDVTSDINNIMYAAYQDHPFRFFSLYHGFDTSTLENDPRVLGEG